MISVQGSRCLLSFAASLILLHCGTVVRLIPRPPHTHTQINMTTLAVEGSDNDAVLAYLQRMSEAVAVLASDFDSASDDSGVADALRSQNKSCEYYVDRIARDLLAAARLDRICRDLPPSVLASTERERADQGKFRYRSRIDLLRNVLRSMASVALDVGSLAAASAVAIVKNNDYSDDPSVASTIVGAFILFATWLPVAPQLAPIVADLFALPSFASPFDCLAHLAEVSDEDADADGDATMSDSGDDNPAALLRPDWKSLARCFVAESTNELCGFYAKRGEHDTIRRWWNWSGLFGLLHSSTSLQPEEALTRVADDTSYGDDMAWETTECGFGYWSGQTYDMDKATTWYAARSIGHMMDLRPSARSAYIQRLGAQEESVPWQLHPWILEQEDELAQSRQVAGIVAIDVGGKEVVEVPLPTLGQIRQSVSVHPSLVHVGQGILLPKRHTVTPSSTRSDGAHSKTEEAVAPRRKNTLDSNDPNPHPQQKRRNLILTSTTSRNISLLGAALCSDPFPPPVLICGPPGAGKSSLVRELAHYCSSVSRHGEGGGEKEPLSHLDELLELHIDEETDSKTLLGCYAATDIPGEFAWRPGALTTAARTGKWVLLEDVESCPVEIQAALVLLLKERILPLGGEREVRCHPNFRLFGTCTTSLDSLSSGDGPGKQLRRSGRSTAGAGGRRILHPDLWRRVHVDPIPFSELWDISCELYPSLPSSILESSLQVLRLLDRSGRSELAGRSGPAGSQDNDKDGDNIMDDQEDIAEPFRSTTGGRPSSVRDYMKLLSRISDNIKFEPNIQFATESQQTLCLAETVDVFAASMPSAAQRREFVTRIAAPTWNVSIDLALRYVETRRPTMEISGTFVELGRATMPNASDGAIFADKIERQSKKFAETNYSLRLMETVGVCIVQNEPILLVGETGCGKTVSTSNVVGAFVLLSSSLSFRSSFQSNHLSLLNLTSSDLGADAGSALSICNKERSSRPELIAAN